VSKKDRLRRLELALIRYVGDVEHVRGAMGHGENRPHRLEELRTELAEARAELGRETGLRLERAFGPTTPADTNGGWAEPEELERHEEELAELDRDLEALKREEELNLEGLDGLDEPLELAITAGTTITVDPNGTVTIRTFPSEPAGAAESPPDTGPDPIDVRMALGLHAVADELLRYEPGTRLRELGANLSVTYTEWLGEHGWIIEPDPTPDR
jgi:hypothetical protein